MFFVQYSGLAKFTATNATEPSPPSDLEVFQNNPILLHRFVSEGNVNGVRLAFVSRTSVNIEREIVLCNLYSVPVQ